MGARSDINIKNEEVLRPKKLLFFGIQDLYPKILNGVVYLSSLCFITWALWITFFIRYIKSFIWMVFTVAIVFSVFRSIIWVLSIQDVKPFKKSKKFLKLSIYTDKGIKILGSSLVIFLLLFASFDKSAFISQSFLRFFDTAEIGLIMLAMLIFILVFCVITFFAVHQFLLCWASKFKSEEVRELFIIIPLLLLCIIWIFGAFLIFTQYDRLVGWIFGFSLLALHSYYLFNELTISIKRRLFNN